MRILPALLLTLAAYPCLAQDQPGVIDCSSQTAIHTLASGTRYSNRGPCDLIVLSPAAYEHIHAESEQWRGRFLASEEAHRELTGMVATKDSIIGVQAQEIQAFERHNADMQRLLGEVTTRLDESIRISDEAIRIAHRNRTLGIVAGAGLGAIAGLVVGALAL